MESAGSPGASGALESATHESVCGERMASLAFIISEMSLKKFLKRSISIFLNFGLSCICTSLGVTKDNVLLLYKSAKRYRFISLLLQREASSISPQGRHDYIAQ